MTSVRPLGDRVLLLFPEDEYRMDGGVLVNDGHRLDALVVAVGPRAKTEAGVGDRVVVDPDFHGIPVDYEGMRYREVSSERLLAVLG